MTDVSKSHCTYEILSNTIKSVLSYIDENTEYLIHDFVKNKDNMWIQCFINNIINKISTIFQQLVNMKKKLKPLQGL